MTKNVARLFLVAAVGVLVCVAGCARLDGRQRLAEQLIAASELHIVYAESVVAGFRDNARQRGTPDEEINCVTTKMTPELVRPVLADAYAAQFSEDELRQAISFFESEAGKAYNRHTRATLREAFGMPTGSVPELSADEAERVDAFLQTRLAVEMGDRNSAVSTSVRETMRPRFLEIFRQCDNAR